MVEPNSPRPQSMQAFFVIWAGQACSLFGSSLVQFALIWYLTSSTGSATVLATASLIGLLPQILLGPFAGALVDRWPRRLVMILADGLIALVTAGAALMFLLHREALWQIYVLLFVRSLGGAFHWPAMQASTTLMVPDRHLARVGGMNQALQGAMGITTPPLGALLLAVISMPAILAIDIATALLAIAPLMFIGIPQPQPMAAGQTTARPAAGASSLLSDMWDGARWLWGFPGVLLLCAMGTLIRLLVWPGAALLPILVTRHFGGGAAQLAVLQTSGGIGLVLGGLTLGAWGGFRRRIVTTLVALLLDGIAIAVVALSPREALALATVAFFCSGFVEPFALGCMAAVFQSTVPPAMQGRILALVTALGTAMVPLGLAVAGPAADAFGPQIWFLVGGIAMIAMAAGAFFVRPIMEVESQLGVALA